jgi:GTPase SAR1 family protein
MFDLSELEFNKKRDRIVILGRRSSGKTAFLSVLYDKLWNSDGQIRMKAIEGQNHLDFIKMAEGIRNGYWPAATLGLTETLIEIDYQGDKEIVVGLDYPGELFSNALVKGAESEEVEIFFEHIDRAKGIILLVDPEHLIGEDVEARVDNDYGFLKVLERINNWPDGSEIPVVLVITKADENSNLIKQYGGTKQFAQKYFKNLSRQQGHIKVCRVSALHETKLPEDKKIFIPIEQTLIYCCDKIREIEEFNIQKIIKKKTAIEIAKIQKQNLKYQNIKTLSLCVLFTLLFLAVLWLVIQISPKSIWYNLWANTVGRLGA